MSMADRIAVMKDGRVEQFAPPTEIYDRPTSLFVNQFVGATNLIAGTVGARDAQQCVVEVASAGKLVLPAPSVAGSGDVVVSVRPENLRIVPGGTAGALGGTIRMVMPVGAFAIHEVELDDGQTVKVTELRKAGTSLHASGTAVALEIVAVDAATVFGKASQTPV